MGHRIKDFGKKIDATINKFTKVKNLRAYIVIVVALVGFVLLVSSRAATFSISIEPELSNDRSQCVKNVQDNTASGGSAVQFCTASVVTPPSDGNAGAHLPINYDIGILGNAVKYVATNGSDTNPGTKDSPYATLSKAIGASSTNGSIVIRGGLYRGQRNNNISKSGLKIKAYPGEIPEFIDSTVVTGGWNTEGSYKWISYTPRPLSTAQGVPFDNVGQSQNLWSDGEKVGGVGRYADQAWIGSNQLRQVGAKSYIADGKFWVDQSNKRLYMTATDASKQNIEVSSNVGDSDYLISISATDVLIEGLKINRYSADANDEGVIKVGKGSNNTVIKNVVISDLPYMAIKVYWSDNVLVQNATINKVGWQTINTYQTDNFTLDSSVINEADYFDEFSGSPASGALKTSQNRNTTVSNSSFSGNLSHTLWFDQSNINTTVAKNTFSNNGDSSIFFEISDGLNLLNNYFKGTGGHQTVRAIGSSGVVAINNTIVGGGAPFSIMTDDRSRVGCNATRACQHYSSDVQQRFPKPASMDWMPRLDLMLNNIIVNPTANAYICGGLVVVCITTTHGSNQAPIQTIIHKADSSRSIPQTKIDGNVYANGTGTLIRVSSPSANYSSLSAWTSAMAGLPVGIVGIDANSKAGVSWVNDDGSPTSSLATVHNQAVAVPADATINKWIPAGTKHYGVLNK